MKLEYDFDRLNEILFESIERLADEKTMENDLNNQVKRSNAISKTAQTIINNVKTNINAYNIRKTTSVIVADSCEMK